MGIAQPAIVLNVSTSLVMRVPFVLERDKPQVPTLAEPVKERRALKLEKKQAAAAARIAEAAGETSPTPDAPEGEDASADTPEQSTEATTLD